MLNLRPNVELSFFSEHALSELDSFIKATVKHSYKGLYAQEAIDFFLYYLDKKDILEESKHHPIIILREDGKITGTATLIERHVKRLFVGPASQGKGYGKLLMKEMEAIAVQNGYTFIELHSSLFAKCFYDRLNYLTFKMDNIPVENNQVLPYYRMAKFLKKNFAKTAFNINGDCFILRTASILNPLFSIGTKFKFYQQENLFFSEYSNEFIREGEMFGAFEGDTKQLYYSYINERTSTREGGVLTFEMINNEIRLSLSEMDVAQTKGVRRESNTIVLVKYPLI